MVNKSEKYKNPFSPDEFPNCFRGYQYAVDVLDGKILACEYIKGACLRFLNDIENELHPKFVFKPKIAEKYLRTVQKFHHVIGNWDTPNMVFEPWQCWVWMNITGFVNRETGFRRFRTAHVEIARGNGKSAMASTAALYFAFLDNPNGNEVSCAATKKDQARIVLDSARAMAKKNAGFRKHAGVRVLAHSLVQESTNSKVRALSAEASSLDGLQDVLEILDELHAMNRDTFEVLTSGMSKRSDSLVLCITTAGSDIESVGYSQSMYARQVCTGEMKDETFFAAVYTLDKADEKDIYNEANWVKANPNWGVSVDKDTMRAKAKKASVVAADVKGFKIKHLNLWIDSLEAYFDLEAWDKCADPSLNIDDFKKIQGTMGLDLASVDDLATRAQVFKKDDIYYVFEKTFLPKDTFDQTENDLYKQAEKDGELIVTPGQAINHAFIREDIEDFLLDHRIEECAYDPWNATEMSQNLAEKVEMVKFAMNVGNMSEPMKKLLALMKRGKVRHNGSKLLRWTMGNVVAKEDHNANVYPRKNHVKMKIDPPIAILMALALHLQKELKESVYETQGIRRL